MIIFSLTIMAALVVGTFFLVWRRIIHPLGMPVLAAASFAYLYVFQPAYLLETGAAQFYLDDWQITKALLVCALMYSAFLWGWLGGRKRLPRQDHAKRWYYGKLYRRGLLLSCIGMGLFIVFMEQSGGVLYFYSAAHGAHGAWQEQTAWVYLGKLLVFPGLAIMLIAVLRGRATPVRWGGIVAVTGAVLVHGVLTASRGTLFPLITVLGVTGFLVLRKLPSTQTVLLAGAATFIAVLALVGYRSVLHLGEKETDQPGFGEAILAYSVVHDKEIRAGVVHAEFLITAGYIDAVDKTQRYNLGSNWLYLVTIHLVPRILWNEKPYDWNIGLTHQDLPSILGWGLTGGAAPSLVGDFYRQFGIFSAILWFGLGRFSRSLFNRAWSTSSPIWQIAYVLLFAFGLNLFAQGFAQLLKFYLYTAVPSLLLIASCRRRSQRIQVIPVDRAGNRNLHTHHHSEKGGDRRR